eukprot:13337145-Alexandrium_andersonii.AAC.1
MGPGGSAPEAPEAGRTDDGQLEADLEAVMDWMGNFEQGLPAESAEDLQLGQGPRTGPLEYPEQGAVSDSSDSSQLRHAAWVL